MKQYKLYVFLLFIIGFQSLFGLTEGRIKEDRIPSMVVKGSIESSSVTYVAPFFNYFAFNFGLFSERHNLYGIKMGGAFQWIDGQSSAGLFGANLIFSGANRNLSAIYIGTEAFFSYLYGNKTTGFSFNADGKYLFQPSGEELTTISGTPGIYIFLTETLILTTGPGMGYSFIIDKGIFFNFTVSLEGYFWK